MTDQPLGVKQLADHGATRRGQGRGPRTPTTAVCSTCGTKKRSERSSCPKDRQLWRDYGWRCADWVALVTFQGGTCVKPGCTRTDLVLDEDHVTGEVRGAPCRRHNGYVAEWLVEYVTNPPGRQLGLRVDVERTRASRARKRNWTRKTTKTRRPPRRPEPRRVDDVRIRLRAAYDENVGRR